MEQEAQLIWNKACEEYIKSEISNLSYTTWFKPAKAFFDQENNFVLSVPNELTLNHLEPYEDLIVNAIACATSIKFNLKFVLSDQYQEMTLKPDTNRIQNKFSQTLNLNPNYTFDNFIVGDSNNVAYAACISIASMQNSQYNNPLFLYGGSGLGKTHLMQAIGNQVKKNFPDKNIVYVNTESFSNEFIEAIQIKNFDAFRNKYRQADLLLIDDVQFLEKKEKMQEEFFHTFNALFESGKNIVLTCDKRPQSLSTLEERLRTRMSSGICIDIKAPDYETRIAILESWAQRHHANIPKEVFEFIASNISSSIRELEGAFKTVIAYTMLGHNINLETASNALSDLIKPKTKKAVTADLIMNVTANFFQVSSADLISKKRSKEIVEPRQIAMYLCRSLINMTFSDIGSAFGGKNHATVMHAYEKTKQALEKDPIFQEKVASISERLKQ